MASLSLFFILLCLLSHGIYSENPVRRGRDVFCSSESFAGNPNNSSSVFEYERSYELFYMLKDMTMDAKLNKIGFSGSMFTWNETTEPKVYDSYFCRGDMTPDRCSSCIYNAAWELNTYCNRSREGYFFGDECSINYSNNRDVVASYHLEPCLRRYSQKSFTKEKQYLKLQEFIKTTIGGELASKAARDNSGKKFATKELKLSSFQTLYSLVQCTPDLEVDECINCISSSVSLLVYPGYKGASIYRPKCNVRYELYLFYQINDPKVLQLVLKIECGVLIATILVFAQFVLGCIRRRVHDTWHGGCFRLLYTLITIGIPYLIGLMRTVDLSIKLCPIWAFFL